MPTSPTRIGVPTIELPIDSTTAVPSLASLVFSASSITPTDSLLNDVNPNLRTTDIYQVAIGLVGRDTTNGGYTVNVTSGGSGFVTVTAGQMIEVKVPNANWPANFDKAICALVFLKTNAGNFQLCQFAQIPQSEDFSTVVKTRPIRVAPSFAFSLLSAATADTVLGDRAPLGVTYEEITPTTGNFSRRRAVSSVTVSPNTAADFTIATTRSPVITFQALNNDLKTIVRAAGGNYAQYTSGGVVHREAHMSKNTAQAILTGNKPVKVNLPADEFGAAETVLYMGLLTVNQTEFEEAWSKTAPTPISFTLQSAALDRLTNGIDSEIAKYSR